MAESRPPDLGLAGGRGSGLRLDGGAAGWGVGGAGTGGDSGGRLVGDQALVEQDVERGRDRDGHEGPDQAEDGGPDEAGDEHGGRPQLDRGLQHPGGDQVVLQLLVGDEERRHQQGRGPQLGGEQGHGDPDDRPQGGPDHGDEVADGDHERQRQGERHPEDAEGDPGGDPGDDRDDDVADHVAADLVDHQVDDLAGPGAALDREQPHQPGPDPGHVGHEVDGEDQDGQAVEDRPEDPAGEAEQAGAEPTREGADHAPELVGEVEAVVQLAELRGALLEAGQVAGQVVDKDGEMAPQRNSTPGRSRSGGVEGTMSPMLPRGAPMSDPGDLTDMTRTRYQVACVLFPGTSGRMLAAAGPAGGAG